MSQIPYSKPAISIDNQIQLLESRGMVFQDKANAKQKLANLNYYRLRGYWIPFETNNTTHVFEDNLSFEYVLEIYDFDQMLRLLLLGALEKVEISVRTQFAYYLSMEYGSDAFSQNTIFKDQTLYQDAHRLLVREYHRSSEIFITHFKNTYSDTLPPIWALSEIMSFGQLSKVYENLDKRKDKNGISKNYDLDERIFRSILHHLTVVRNKCAHYSRVYNSIFPFAFTLPNRPSELANSFNDSEVSKIYNTLTVIAYLLEKIDSKQQFISQTKDLLQNSNCVSPATMGFPSDWENLPIWVEI